jgi:hypothetical protein
MYNLKNCTTLERLQVIYLSSAVENNSSSSRGCSTLSWRKENILLIYKLYNDKDS